MTVLLECIHIYHKIDVVNVLLEYIYTHIENLDLQSYFSQALPIMRWLCLILLVTYYAQNYTCIISWSLKIIKVTYFIDSR